MSLTRKDAKNETRTMWRSLDPVLLLVSWALSAFGILAVYAAGTTSRASSPALPAQ
jgi:cell division protein FtsW (lipid II flippase)